MNHAHPGDYHYNNGVGPSDQFVQYNGLTTPGTKPQNSVAHPPVQNNGLAVPSTTTYQNVSPPRAAVCNGLHVRAGDSNGHSVTSCTHPPADYRGDFTTPNQTPRHSTQCNGHHVTVGDTNTPNPTTRPPVAYNGHTSYNTTIQIRARHPEFADKNNRLYSYMSWQISDIQDPKKLTNLGFFYTGEADLVRCFYCSIGLRDFIASDDPLLEHVRYSGNCEFVIQILGRNNLREIKESFRNGTPINSSKYYGCILASQHTAEVHAPNEIRPVEKKPPPPPPPPQQQQHVSEYRHPDYRSYQVRVSSYSGWPSHLVQTPDKLAEAGFYYTGTRDIVRCFACDGGLQKWDPTDDPWIEHCINFPTCVYVKRTKGDDYIALALAHHRQSNNMETKIKTVDQSFNHFHLQERNESNKGRNTLEKTKLQVVGMGYSMDDINKALDNLNREMRNSTVDEIIDEIERQRIEENPSPKDIIKEHEKLKEELFCTHCKEKDINILFLPCQHHRYCEDCSKHLTQCFICGTTIAHKIKTYRP